MYKIILLVTLFVSLIFSSCGVETDEGAELKDAYKPINFRIDNKFSTSERNVIESAINKVAKRFLDINIHQCAKRNDSRGRGDNVYKKLVGWKFKSRSMFPTVQSPVLEQEGFPVLNIKYLNESSDTLGRAFRKDRVIIKYTNYVPNDETMRPMFFTGMVKGEFKVYLNSYQLKQNSDSNFWAGTIAHEMLHNMGHHHKNDSNGSWEDNYARFFITEFGNCLEHNGNYNNSTGGFGLVSRYNL